MYANPGHNQNCGHSYHLCKTSRKYKGSDKVTYKASQYSKKYCEVYCESCCQTKTPVMCPYALCQVETSTMIAMLSAANNVNTNCE